MRKENWITNKLINCVGLILILVLGATATVEDSFAQRKKKKGKNNSEVDAEAARKKYEFELLKSWSFGFENYKNKQYDSSKKHFWNVAKLDTINKFGAKTYRYLGNSYLNGGDPDSAQVIFELGAEKYPEYTYLHQMLGYLLSNRGLTEEAVERYKKVVEQKPESVDDWNQLASLYVKLEQDQDAIAAYDKILALEPDNMDALQKKTALIGRSGDIEALIAENEKIRELDPQNSQVRFDLGRLYFEQVEDFEKSIERFQEFLSAVPNDIAAMQYVGNAYRRLDKSNNAITQFKAILQVQPENKKVMAEISRCYKDLGRFVRARSYARKVLAIDKAYGMGWIALGEAYEASAERCINQKDSKVGFNDKLVYELASVQYKKALADLEFRQDAERHLSFLQGVLPTQEDRFMHKNQEKATGECYKWIY